MENRIKLEMRGLSPFEVTELNLDNCKASQVDGLTEEFVNLEALSLINAGLTTLKGFPRLPNIRKLELSDNRIANGLDHLYEKFGEKETSKLTHLSLSGNKIGDIQSLEPLQKLATLKSLDLFNCPVTTEEKYRDKVFDLLPQLKFLDGLDREENNEEEMSDDEEVEDEDDEYDEDEEDEDGDTEENYVDDEDDEDDEEDGLEGLEEEEKFNGEGSGLQEINDNDLEGDDEDDGEEDDEDDDDDEEEDDDEEDVGLEYLLKDIAPDQDGDLNDEEFVPQEGSSDEDIEEEVNEEKEERGLKRKLEPDDEKGE